MLKVKKRIRQDGKLETTLEQDKVVLKQTSDARYGHGS